MGHKKKMTVSLLKMCLMEDQKYWFQPASIFKNTVKHTDHCDGCQSEINHLYKLCIFCLDQSEREVIQPVYIQLA